jgi:hypothetical protein
VLSRKFTTRSNQRTGFNKIAWSIGTIALSIIKSNSKISCLVLFGLFVIWQSNFAQIKNSNNLTNPDIAPKVSGIHTLSIHVNDTISHDSVYQFFAQKLLLPVYYTPVMIADRRYVGVYAGNMVLEPCGPYQNIDYATDNFKAIFFGMNFEVNNSLFICEQALRMRGIVHQVNKGSIYIRDSKLSNENIFTALYEVNDKQKRDSLQNMLRIQEKPNSGIEYIKEVHIGYKNDLNYQKWKEYLYPLEFRQNGVCQINDSLQLFFTQGEINEVKAITFKVKSLEETEHYLLDNQLSVTYYNNGISINPVQAFDLPIYFSDVR